MDRRSFTRALTFAAGSIGLFQAGQHVKADDETEPPNAPKRAVPGDAKARTESQATAPVNVADFQRLAKHTLPRATYDYITSGSADELTLEANVEAFRRINVLPPLLRGVSEADLRTTVLGRQIELPVMLAPVAAQRMYHPEGAPAAARAAAAAGTVFGVSTSAGNSVEEIAESSKGPKWFQLYVPKDRAVARRLVQRVERAGYEAIIVTVDLGEWKDADRRNRFALPKEMLVKHLRDVGYETVSAKMSYQEVLDFNMQAWDLSLSWEFFDWLRGVTKLPLLVKGLMREDDAQKAVAVGLDGIIVSNHGGRRLDTMPATIDMLPGVVRAVGGKTEVYVDGGIRRGTDVLKALALGAKAVLIGRPYAWALSVQGEAGVSKVIDLFRAELLNAMVATGCAKISDVNRSLLMT